MRTTFCEYTEIMVFNQFGKSILLLTRGRIYDTGQSNNWQLFIYWTS